MQRSTRSVRGLPLRTQRTKGCRFVHLLRCEGHWDREDVSPVSTAQPTHTASVSCCLFGISTEVLLHQTFLFKCWQHHMSVRQIGYRLLHTSSSQSSDWARSINKLGWTLNIRIFSFLSLMLFCAGSISLGSINFPVNTVIFKVAWGFIFSFELLETCFRRGKKKC